jgi:hypothetical protein
MNSMSGISVKKPAASLTGSLLTNKGGARPGQRYDNEVTEVYQSRRRIILNAERVRDVSDFNGGGGLDAQDHIDDSAVYINTTTEPAPVEVVAQAAPVWREGDKLPGARSVAGKARVAYTVRLDAERHAQLRFTASHQHRSAQQVMLDALDRYLSVAVPFLLNDK